MMIPTWMLTLTLETTMAVAVPEEALLKENAGRMVRLTHVLSTRTIFNLPHAQAFVPRVTAARVSRCNGHGLQRNQGELCHLPPRAMTSPKVRAFHRTPFVRISQSPLQKPHPPSQSRMLAQLLTPLSSISHPLNPPLEPKPIALIPSQSSTTHGSLGFLIFDQPAFATSLNTPPLKQEVQPFHRTRSNDKFVSHIWYIVKIHNALRPRLWNWYFLHSSHTLVHPRSNFS